MRGKDVPPFLISCPLTKDNASENPGGTWKDNPGSGCGPDRRWRDKGGTAVPGVEGTEEAEDRLLRCHVRLPSFALRDCSNLSIKG